MSFGGNLRRVGRCMEIAQEIFLQKTKIKIGLNRVVGEKNRRQTTFGRVERQGGIRGDCN